MFKYILIILTFVLTFADVDARRRRHHNENDTMHNNINPIITKLKNLTKTSC
jgi:hypothetical protein